MKRLLTLLLLFCTLGAWAEGGVETMEYARGESGALSLDLYRPTGSVDKQTTVVYVFGGGFVMGSKTEKHNVDFFRKLTDRGYTVAAIDYRLGLKGVTKVSPLNPKPVFAAVAMAVEDFSSATAFLIQNAVKLGIDTARMVAMGSSAGAITVLQADYERSRRSPVVATTPAGFRYAGVVAFAGSVFSTRGGLFYREKPAPTLMFHGTRDNVVVYKKMELFNIGMYGTDALTRLFNKKGFPYTTVRYRDAKHEVAEFPRYYNIDIVCGFIDRAVEKNYDNQIDITVRDRKALKTYQLNLTRKDLYNNGH